MTATIQLDAVSFAYGATPILNAVSASVSVGEFVCLLGPNGAGKSTLAQLIAGELAPAHGRVSLVDAPAAASASAPGRRVAYLPQDVQDPPFVAVRELVALGRFRPRATLGWRISAQDKAAVQRCIARCLLEPLADRPFAQLSGGEKQRVWLAFCLAQERDFLLLDESLHKIDHATRDLFFRMLSDLATEGMGVILITHDLDMAIRHAHRILVLNHGELAYNGPPNRIIYTLM